MEELVQQVFQTQKLSPVKNDWCLQIEDDLRYCEIKLSESEIRAMNKKKFKSIVTSSIFKVARQYLVFQKNKHSKCEGLSANDKMQDYLSSEKLTTEEKQLLFQLRTRSYDCKANFRNLYKNQLACFICGQEDNQPHLLSCTATTQGLDLTNVQYSDIFGTIEKQVRITKILMQISNRRKAILKTSNIGSQVHR